MNSTVIEGVELAEELLAKLGEIEGVKSLFALLRFSLSPIKNAIKAPVEAGRTEYIF
jgi:hypothetical protein